jgi:hypothetical protein
MALEDEELAEVITARPGLSGLESQDGTYRFGFLAVRVILLVG